MQLVSSKHLGMRTGRLMAHSCPSFLRLVLLLGGIIAAMLSHCCKAGLGPAALLTAKPEVSPSKCDGIGIGLFHRLEKICQDCGNLYLSDEVTGICRFNCFNNRGFAFCLKTLHVDEKDSEQLVSLVEDRQSDLLLH
uniref:Crustacean hyperglycemic hormone n=1 Tax=Tigriopus japonicus TaxID=158387 RepID=S4X5F0_TIGJA|nr:crustacean hyperglycemic hormone [Tigriopus japonicus]